MQRQPGPGRSRHTVAIARRLGLLGALALIQPVLAQQMTASLSRASLSSIGHDGQVPRSDSAVPDGGELPQATVVGGAAMSPARGLFANLQLSQEHLAFVAGLQTSGLAQRLTVAPGQGKHAEYTVFAPVDAAFPVDLGLGVPASGPGPSLTARALARLLANHIVAGRIGPQALAARVAQGHGQAWLTTLDGERLTVTSPGRGLFDVTDARGGTARVLVAGVPQANGALYVVDRLLEPASAPGPGPSRPPAPPASPAAAGRKPGRASART